MPRKTGDLREALMEAIDQVKAGKMDPGKATAIAKLAGQISLSIQVEANIRVAKLVDGATPLGDVSIGAATPALSPPQDFDDEPVITQETPPAPRFPDTIFRTITHVLSDTPVPPKSREPLTAPLSDDDD